jgi:hypothetical protein
MSRKSKVSPCTSQSGQESRQIQDAKENTGRSVDELFAVRSDSDPRHIILAGGNSLFLRNVSIYLEACVALTSIKTTI